MPKKQDNSSIKVESIAQKVYENSKEENFTVPVQEEVLPLNDAGIDLYNHIEQYYSEDPSNTSIAYLNKKIHDSFFSGSISFKEMKFLKEKVEKYVMEYHYGK